MPEPDSTDGRQSAATGPVKLAAALTSLVVAAAGLTLSYVSLADFARGAGVSDPYVYLFPLTVIGLVAMGFLEALQAALLGSRGWFGRLLIVLGIAFLVAGGVGGVEGREVAGVTAAVLPPVSLLLTLEALLHIVRRYGPLQRSAGSRTGRQARRERKEERALERQVKREERQKERQQRERQKERERKPGGASGMSGLSARKGGGGSGRDRDRDEEDDRRGRRFKGGGGLGKGRPGRSDDDEDALEPAGSRR